MSSSASASSAWSPISGARSWPAASSPSPATSSPSCRCWPSGPGGRSAASSSSRWRAAPFERAPRAALQQALAGLPPEPGDRVALAAQAAALERASGGTLTLFDREGTRRLGAASLEDPPGHGRVILPLLEHGGIVGL